MNTAPWGRFFVDFLPVSTYNKLLIATKTLTYGGSPYANAENEESGAQNGAVRGAAHPGSGGEEGALAGIKAPEPEEIAPIRAMVERAGYRVVVGG